MSEYTKRQIATHIYGLFEERPEAVNQDEDESYEYPSNEPVEDEEYKDFDKEVNEDPYEGSGEKPFWWTDETRY
ncbi:MAG: hypothetical protein JXB29_11175 [Sedimentisphaerales bacterium]|nr:hypothetical protein [Sedimentisphaerales bacterium]